MYFDVIIGMIDRKFFRKNLILYFYMLIIFFDEKINVKNFISRNDIIDSLLMKFFGFVI